MSRNTANTSDYLLKVDGLKTWFPVKKGLLRRTVGFTKAVDGVSFIIRPGQTLGLVGESGCGKTTVARSIVRLVPATEGVISFDGTDILSARGDELRRLRSKIGLVFQDPYASLNPRMTVAGIIGEPLKVHHRIAGSESARHGGLEGVAALLSKVGLSPDLMNRYPHEFSAGQRQRIGIARALAPGARLVICDEPVSALDVSIRAQILNLLKDLQEELVLTYLFIAHDLAVVEFACDSVAVMFAGRIVEMADAEELFKNPLHPYTRQLISACQPGRTCQNGPPEWPAILASLVSSTRCANKVAVPSEPSGSHPHRGCPFLSRCPLSEGICRRRVPTLGQTSRGSGHLAACWKSSR